MTDRAAHPSAAIYQFPKGGRVSIRAMPSRSVGGNVVKMASANAPVTSFGGAWYHDAAISDAEVASRR